MAEQTVTVTPIQLPPPSVLDIHDAQASEKWARFKRAWDSYALAMELGKKSEAIQVATLLTVIGEDAREVFSTFTWANEGDDAKIAIVLQKFEQYCRPRRNVPFERYCFNRRMQEDGETYEQYRTALRKLSQTCEFNSITPQEILRDRLVFGINNDKVRERLLREANLTLDKTDEICRAAESMVHQMKVVGEGTTVNAVAGKRRSEDTTVSSAKPTRECWNCGRRHQFHKRELCPAYGKTCNKCNKLNHFAVKCRTQTKEVSAVKPNEEITKSGVAATKDDLDEVFPTEVSAVGIDDSQLVTVQLESGNYLRFQVDTGAQCNVVPMALYKKATMDTRLENISAMESNITAYGGTTLPVVGTVTLLVTRGSKRYKLHCKLVNCKNIRPLLGRKACLKMDIISYLDNDELHRPNTGNSPVYTIEVSSAVSKEELIKKYPTVFGPGIGMLPGEYHIRINEQCHPTQQAPRRIPVAIRDQLKATLDQLTQQGVLKPVTEPTAWISSMVAVKKKNGNLRICLDPKDLNCAIQREHYQLPTIEDVATRLHGAKLFTILDVRNGFWHVSLDEQSSLLTTFHTPFGRYRWTRMPFGICSAPEVFQRKMHELIEGLCGVEVVADDFVAIGRGSTIEEASKDHDRNLGGLLQRCHERGVKLNADKIKFKMTEVPFIGHVATSEGLSIDPCKVLAIRDMPTPTNVAAVQRLLGLAQYLSKFLPHLSDITKPLRDLTQKDIEWTWGSAQQTAFETLKTVVSSAPVLRYYNLGEEVTLQCDASQSGLGVALLQGGQPVAYASRALTETETRYAQIEKELLAIVYGCDHFDAYVYGRDMVNVETDHKPLESIMLKPLDSAPKRLQRMLLQLQKYTLSVKYKQGTQMFLADTLSRAHRSEVHSCEFTTGLEEMDQTLSLAICDDQLKQIKQASTDDPILSVLRQVIIKGWPLKRIEVPEGIRSYFDVRDELTTQGDLVFKGQRLVIPTVLRKEVMSTIHSTHVGLEGCLRRARDSVYWPQMTVQLKDFVSKCDICLAFRDSPGKESLIQHELPTRPWSKIGVDLCELQGRTLLVLIDYYSNFIEVERVTNLTTQGVTKVLKEMFARYGVPDQVMSDNGPQFSSANFRSFATEWRFNHVTSSPHYPQSNGKVENAVKTVKRLFNKCRDAGTSEYQALLDWRNTPTEGMGTSPAQRFLGRRCRTLLPTCTILLKPHFSVQKDIQNQKQLKQRQKRYYDRHVKDLPALHPGDLVQLRLPGQVKWTVGICTKIAGQRSYEVKVGNTIYRRNRRQLIFVKANKQKQISSPNQIEEIPSQSDHVSPSNISDQSPEHPDTPSSIDSDLEESNTMAEDNNAMMPRRSGRTTRKPAWMADYIPS